MFLAHYTDAFNVSISLRVTARHLTKINLNFIVICAKMMDSAAQDERIFLSNTHMHLHSGELGRCVTNDKRQLRDVCGHR